MVSNARLDLPEPDSPVNTIRESRGSSRETSLRLCSRAPRMISCSATVGPRDPGSAGAFEQTFAIVAGGWEGAAETGTSARREVGWAGEHVPEDPSDR